MSLGIQPSVSQLNAQAGQIALNFRNAVDQVNYFNDYIQNLGEAGLTAAPFSMSTADATNLITMFANLASVTEVLEGQSYTGPALPFNFIQATVALWGGQ